MAPGPLLGDPDQLYAVDGSRFGREAAQQGGQPRLHMLPGCCHTLFGLYMQYNHFSAAIAAKFDHLSILGTSRQRAHSSTGAGGGSSIARLFLDARLYANFWTLPTAHIVVFRHSKVR